MYIYIIDMYIYIYIYSDSNIKGKHSVYFFITWGMNDCISNSYHHTLFTSLIVFLESRTLSDN